MIFHQYTIRVSFSSSLWLNFETDETSPRKSCSLLEPFDGGCVEPVGVHFIKLSSLQQLIGVVEVDFGEMVHSDTCGVMK